MKAVIEIIPNPYEPEWSVRVNQKLIRTCKTVYTAREYAQSIRDAFAVLKIESTIEERPV